MPPMDAEKRKEYNRQYYLKKKDAIANQKKDYYQKSREDILRAKKQYYTDNKDKLTETHKQYYDNNREQMCELKKQYYVKNKEILSAKHKQYYLENKEELLKNNKTYQSDNKEKIKTKQLCEHKKRRLFCKDCSIYTYIVALQRNSIFRILKNTNFTKTKSTIEYLDCSPEYFKEYLQKKMVDGMTFDNIHIDHIKPVNKFDLEDPEELLKCCNYTNMQPLLATVNLSKGDKWSDDDDVFWNENIIFKEYLPLYLPK
jgi:hypothetical protein